MPPYGPTWLGEGLYVLRCRDNKSELRMLLRPAQTHRQTEDREMDMGWAHTWVELGWVGLNFVASVVGSVGLGSVTL